MCESIEKQAAPEDKDDRDALVLSRRDMLMLCFENIYGEPYDPDGVLIPYCGGLPMQ